MECQYIIVYIFCEFNIHRISFRLKPLHVCRVNVMQNFYLYKFRYVRANDENTTTTVTADLTINYDVEKNTSLAEKNQECW